MKFFKDFKNSIYNPGYYKDLLSKRFSYSLKYFFVLILFLALLNAIFLLFTIIPHLKLGIETVQSGVLNNYPDNLEIVLKNGKVSTNVQEPYFINMPLEYQKDFPNIKYFLVVDTNKDFSLNKYQDEIKGYNTLCFLNQKYLICYNKDQKLVSTGFPNAKDFKINKSTIVNFSNKINPFIKFVYPIFGMFIFIGLFVVYCFHLVYLLIASLLILLIAKIKKIKIGYKKSYQLGLHLLTPTFIIQILINLILNFWLPNLHIKFLFTGVFLMMALINLRWQNETVVEQTNLNQ